ncbi:hypothetical protein FQN54_000881 [Arachnomyces sp. PD_36]|nr:hypothetical protein FQN54_000881 [Arachnomyces sp. PD_36]
MIPLNLVSTILLYLIPTLITCYFLQSLVSFTIILRQARASGLPYMVMPYSENNMINTIVMSSEGLARLTRKYLPEWLADIIQFNVLSYRWTVRDRMSKKLGRAFLIVSPGELNCHIADAAVVAHIYRSREQYAKATKLYHIVEIYGPNILTTEDSGWARHRHHTAQAFSEKNNALVWKETIKQVTGMQYHWMIKQNKDPSSRPADFAVPSCREDIVRLTLQIISSAGFGISLPFMPTMDSGAGSKSIHEDGPVPPPGFRFTFRSVTQYMQTHFTSVVFAIKLFPSWLPRSMKKFFIGTELAAYDEMGKYLRNIITMAETGDGHGSSDSLANAMVGSSAQTSGSKFEELTPQEVLGNLHVFTVAGHETTANALKYSLLFLALYPEKQQWVRQGISEALEGQSKDPHDWDYVELFPKLVTPLCVLLETLRLCPAVITVPKWTAYSPVELEYNGEKHILPQWTNIDLDAGGLHYDPEYWGPDATSWDPTRWDASNKNSFLAQNEGTPGLTAAGLEHSTIHKPVRGAFIGFSDGLRSCVGKKFAQVEFVAVLAVLLRDYEVLLERGEGEKEEDVRERAWRVYGESMTVLTLSMVEDVPLRFRKAVV